MFSPLIRARRLGRRENPATVLSRGLEKAERGLGNVLPAAGDNSLQSLSLNELKSWQYAESNLDAVLDTAYGFRGFGAYRSLEPMQFRAELRETAATVAATDPDRVVDRFWEEVRACEADL